MKDFGIKRNASGYYDETAYKGMTAGARPGEIWGRTDTNDFMLILAHEKNVSACLKLDNKPREGKIQVIARVPMFTDPLKVCYCFDDLLSCYVKTLKDSELAIVRKPSSRRWG